MTAWKNQLYFGDNLKILREEIADEHVDLIYLDPPFNSNANYNVLFAEKSGEKSAAQIAAFTDTWHWCADSESAYSDVVLKAGKLSELLSSFRSFLGTNDVMAYVTMMAVRLRELHRVLRPTGSIYLHCDPTASHYLKLVMDAIFGVQNFRNEIIWKRTSSHGSPKRWGPVHDVLLFYSKSDSYHWNSVRQAYEEDYVTNKYGQQDERGPFMTDNLTGAGTREGESGQAWRNLNPTKIGRHWAVPKAEVVAVVGQQKASTMSVQQCLDVLEENGLIVWPKRPKKDGLGLPRFKRYLGEGVTIQDVITDIFPINSQAQERLGYPTQKPEPLLERILNASSNEGDIVLDPFCGCGTSISVAERLHRKWIGIDITHLAITLIRHRLQNAFKTTLAPYEIIGAPSDHAGAVALADTDRYQFQWWALGLVDAKPEDKKKGADKGIDGIIPFMDDSSGKVKKVIIQVKSGGVKRSDISTLKSDVEREKAQIGVFITLEHPTKPMNEEAATAGFYEPLYGKKIPKIQILIIEDLLGGKRIELPHYSPAESFKKAPAQKKGTVPEQGSLLES